MTCDILIVGTGGVGTIAALALSLSGKAPVTAIVRSDYDRVIDRGFDIHSIDYGNYPNWRPDFVSKTIPEAVAGLAARKNKCFDYVVVCTKVLEDICPTNILIGPAIGSTTTIVLLQNGIYIEQPIAIAYPQTAILSGVSMISSTNRGGRVDHVAIDDLEIGVYAQDVICEEYQQREALEFIAMYGKHARFVEDIEYSRWNKVVYNCTLNTICTLTHLDTGRIYLSGLDNSIVIPAMKEVIAIANAALKSRGKSIPWSSAIAKLESDDGTFYKPSMLVDVEKGNPIELEAILGNTLVKSVLVGVEAPILGVIYSLLRGVQFKLLENKGIITVSKQPPRRNTDSRIWHDSFSEESKRLNLKEQAD